MPDHPLPDDAGDLDGPDDLLTRLRPPPPRTWRDRLDDLAADPPSPGRVVLALVVVAVVALVGWRVLAPPPAPPELTLPLAEPAQDAGAAGARAGAPGAEPAAIPGPADAPGGGGGDGDPAGTGATVSSAEVVVHVVGAVAAPGVQRLPTGSRVVDAVEAAGGATPDADLSRVNLAAVLADGQQVVVLRPGEAPPAVIGAGPSGGTGAADDASGAAGAGNGAPVDINRASAAELEELPGVGPATAEAIIAHREQSGPFATVDDLLDVRGIGEAKLEQLRHRVTV